MDPRDGGGSGSRLTSDIERTLIGAATLIASVVLVVYTTIGLTTDSQLLTRLPGVLVIIAIGAAMLIGRRERLLVFLLGTAVVIVVQNAVTDVTTTAGTTAGLVAAAIVGTLFAKGKPVLWVAGFAVVIFAAVVMMYPGDLQRGIIDGFAAVVAMTFGAMMAEWLRKEVEARAARGNVLFDRAPVALFEEDFRKVETWLAELRAAGVTDLEAHLAANPSIVAETAGLIEVTNANPAAVELLEAESRHELIGPLPTNHTGGALRAFITQLIALWDGEDHVSIDVFEGATRSGRPIELKLYWSVPRVGDQPDYSRVSLAMVDVTDSRANERRLRTLLRAKDDFVASVSHELRTPLTAVLGLAEELRDHSDRFTSEEAADLITLLAGQSAEVSMIVDDLLVAARVDTGSIRVRTEEVDLATEVRAVCRALDLGGSVSLDLPADLPKINGDRARVRQIVRNLVVNARKYGGPFVRITARPGPAGLVLDVRDTGPPLADSLREAIFSPYFRAAQTPGLAGSVGLGLTVSRELARLMGGDLSYDHDGEESVFALELTTAGVPQPAPLTPPDRSLVS